MKRLCIYMTYNKENIIKPHAVYMLKALSEVADAIYLVCNYAKIQNEEQEIHDYVSSVFYRGNIGWDAGAYKDALCTMIGWEEVLKFDELILANDSFYGPLFPLQESFDLFAQSDCDYWGLSGQIAGCYEEADYEFADHVHSYFMVFKRNVLHSRTFRNYWEKLAYPVFFMDALIKYEQEINITLKKAGFKTDSYTEHFDFSMERNEIPCYTHLYELVKQYRYPVVKRKSLLIRNPGYVNALAAVEYINQYTDYPVSMLDDVIDGQFEDMADFYSCFKKIYIYGHGVCGKNLAEYFRYKKWKTEGFVVSTREEAETGENIRWVEDMSADKDTGIIISLLNLEAAEDIRKHLSKRVREDQMFLIARCSGIQGFK